jgi:uncharacterized membrane protein HdeD (DUF308 family)
VAYAPIRVTTYPQAQPAWDRRRLVYGDWTWLVRDGLDVIRLAFIGGTIAFAIHGRSDVVALTAASAVLLIARVVSLPRWFDFGLTVAMTLIAWGRRSTCTASGPITTRSCTLCRPWPMRPFCTSHSCGSGSCPTLVRRIRERRVAQISGVFIVTLALGMAVGAGYENVEWFEDKFGILGGHFVKGLWDTETDLLADTSGSLVGAVFLTVWSLRGWSSRRVTVVPVPEPSASAFQAAAERLRPKHGSRGVPWESRLGGLPLAAQGIVFVVGGVLLLALPAPSLRTVGIVFGSALLAYAAFEAVELVPATGRTQRTAQFATMTASAGAGTLVLSWPTIAQLTPLYAAGAATVVLAVAEAASLSSKPDSREQWLGAAASVVAFVFGIAMLAGPGRSLDAAITLVGIYLLVLGGLRLVHAAEATRDRRASVV